MASSLALDMVIVLLVRCSMYEIDAENVGTLFEISLLPVLNLSQILEFIVGDTVCYILT